MFNATFLKLGLLLTLSVLFSYGQESAPQRLILFLKKPIQDEAVNIKVNQNVETNIKPEKGPKVQETYRENRNNITYLQGNDGKFILTLDLAEPGYIVLEAHHFNGKKVGQLFSGNLFDGKHVFEEQESWKSFMNVKGVAFLTLYINGRKVLKKLISKVE